MGGLIRNRIIYEVINLYCILIMSKLNYGFKGKATHNQCPNVIDDNRSMKSRVKDREVMENYIKENYGERYLTKTYYIKDK